MILFFVKLIQTVFIYKIILVTVRYHREILIKQVEMYMLKQSLFAITEGVFLLGICAHIIEFWDLMEMMFVWM